MRYNEAPIGLIEISKEEWALGMFEYCLTEVESRQVRGDHSTKFSSTFDLRMWQLDYGVPTMGFAVMRDWFDSKKGQNRKKTIIRFCRFGEEYSWKRFVSEFAAQFAGDNS